MSLSETTHRSSPQHDQPSPSRLRNQSRRKTCRSRKGCPDCRRRKIKCDEKRPQCSQCLKAGRACRIIDGLFRPHSFSFPTTSQSSPSSCPKSQTSPSRREERRNSPLDIQTLSYESINGRKHTALQPIDFGSEYRSPTTSSVSPTQNKDPPVARQISLNTASSTSPRGSEQTSSIRPVSNFSPSLMSTTPLSEHQDTPARCSHAHKLQISLSEESPQDRLEITYFLRYASEDPAHWMDVSTGHLPYFSQHIVLLSDRNPLIRYASVALAAKQLGQMNPDNLRARISTTPRQRHIITVLTEALALDEPGPSFLWYGAKYYEKAIQLLFEQLSREDCCSTCHLSPREIYVSDLVTPGSGQSKLDEHKNASLLQIIAACILCQYEDISATKRAIAGHLDGIFKLIRQHLSATTLSETQTLVHVPQSTRALEASFWYFALNDMLDTYNSRKACRLDAEDLLLWRRMGLPLDDTGHLSIDCVPEKDRENTLFKSLIRLMCMFFNSNLSDTTQWVHLEAEFDQFHAMLPLSFSAAIDLSLPLSSKAPEGPLAQEVWFSTDVCAIAMAFYHMIRILLLVNQPRDIFDTRYAAKSSDLLASYNKFQRDLYQHAMVPISIAKARPSNTVRKHLVQPLYVSGRCLTGLSERKGLLELLHEIECELGVVTKYRMKDLLEEWGMPLDIMEAMERARDE